MFSTFDADIRPGSGLGIFELGIYIRCLAYFHADHLLRCLIMDNPRVDTQTPTHLYTGRGEIRSRLLCNHPNNPSFTSSSRLTIFWPPSTTPHHMLPQAAPSASTGNA